MQIECVCIMYMFHRVCICCGETMKPVALPLSADANLCPSCRKLANAFCDTDNSSLIDVTEPSTPVAKEEIPIPEPGSSRSTGLVIPPFQIDSPGRKSSFSE